MTTWSNKVKGYCRVHVWKNGKDTYEEADIPENWTDDEKKQLPDAWNWFLEHKGYYELGSDVRLNYQRRKEIIKEIIEILNQKAVQNSNVTTEALDDLRVQVAKMFNVWY